MPATTDEGTTMDDRTFFERLQGALATYRATNTRTDIHRPSLVDPAEYTFIAAFYQGTSEDMEWSYRDDHQVYYQHIEDMTAQLEGEQVFHGNYATKATCDHCGANFAHGALFRHEPTGDLIHVGHICASDTIGLPSRAAATRRAAEKHARAEAERRARYEAGAEWQAANADVVEYLASIAERENAWRTWNEEHPDAGHPRDGGPRRNPIRAPHAFVLDMGHTLNRWGQLSDRQAAAVRKFQAGDAAFEARQAEREANPDPEPTGPVQVGRREITGKVLSAKFKETDFGSTPKWLLLEGDGNKVWGTIPDAAFGLDGHEHIDSFRGCTVKVTGTVEASRDDEHFGFYKRPSKPSIIEEAPDA